MTTDSPTWLSLAEQAAALDSREISSVELMTAHFDRITEINPTTNAIVTLEPERALAAAWEADQRRAAGEEGLPPLCGVPMTHKDTHDTAGMRTTYGSELFADHVPQRTSSVIARLQAAGVISTGKSNVPEFAAGAHTTNRVFGTTKNPYDATRSAAGSSGGAAAAIACGVQAAGDGSDTGGSLRLPASFNNIVGLRPSHGWIPRTFPEDPWQWLSQPGFMARTVDDVAWLMELCSGTGPGPASTLFGPWRGEATDLSGITAGFSPDLDGLLELETEARDVVAGAASVFVDLGARLSDSVPDLRASRGVFRTARAYEFAANLREVDAALPGRLKASLQADVDAGLALTAHDLFDFDRARARLWSAMNDYFSTHDVLVTVTSQVLPFSAEDEYPTRINSRPIEDYMAWVDSTTLISATGCPALSVPAGFSSTGLPIGMQIIGPVGGDATVLRVARSFEAATGHARRRPDL
ncbi:amidase [Brevibacterium sp. H602]|uniref:amidase n=1 Tax=unclassified Brevibacterium TaxID=2614124 RepID=UPI00397A643C